MCNIRHMLKSEYKKFFLTLGNEQRIEIILCLLEGPKTVTEIVEKVGAQQSTISHNLHQLRACSFVEVEVKGKRRVYSVNKKTISPLFKLIQKHAQTYCKKQCC